MTGYFKEINLARKKIWPFKDSWHLWEQSAIEQNWFDKNRTLSLLSFFFLGGMGVAPTTLN